MQKSAESGKHELLDICVCFSIVLVVFSFFARILLFFVTYLLFSRIHRKLKSENLLNLLIIRKIKKILSTDSDLLLVECCQSILMIKLILNFNDRSNSKSNERQTLKRLEKLEKPQKYQLITLMMDILTEPAVGC